MRAARGSAVVAGVFFIVAAVAGVAGLIAYDPVLSQPDYVLGGGADGRIALGAFLEVLVAVSVIGTAVTLFPVVRRQNEAVALGYVCGRVIEAAIILVGLVGLLSVVTLRQDGGADPGALVAAGRALVAVHDRTFLVGPGLAIGVNTVLLAWLMHRSGLVPRAVAVLGLVGGPLLFASSTAVLFGVYDQVSPWGFLLALPVVGWEMSLAGWLIAKGFRPSPVLAVERHAPPAAAIDRVDTPA